MTKFGDTMEALSSTDVVGNISLIKGAVREQLLQNDSRVSIEMTDHFNHSFVPDLILSWPDVKSPRYMYLRTAFRADDLLRDIETLKVEKPIIMPLGGVAREAEQDAALNLSAQSSSTLIANPEGLEMLQVETEARPVVSLLAHAVLQGGRGVMTPDDARETSTEFDEGFSGAREGDAERTTVAIEAAAELLDSDRAARMNRLLHAVWVGSGGSGSAFPGAAGVTATLDAESLRFVLELPDFEDDEFWRRLGAGITLGRLSELVNVTDSDNLQRLLKDNAYRLIGKAARVVRGTPAETAPRWSVANANLTLRVGQDSVYFAPVKLEELPEPGPTIDLSVANLQERCRSASIKVREVRLSSGDNSISYANETDGDIIDADELAELQRVMTDATLTTAVAITSSHDMTLSFRTRTASGYGPARFPISTMLDVLTPLMIHPSDETALVVRRLVGQPESRRAPEEANGAVSSSTDVLETEPQTPDGGD